jgi:hypothetical protein
MNRIFNFFSFIISYSQQNTQFQKLDLLLSLHDWVGRYLEILNCCKAVVQSVGLNLSNEPDYMPMFSQQDVSDTVSETCSVPEC